MEIRFYIDPETDQPHIYGHDVSEEEVRDVLLRSGEDRAGDEGSRVAIGQTLAGRYLKVIYKRGNTLADWRTSGFSLILQRLGSG